MRLFLCLLPLTIAAAQSPVVATHAFGRPHLAYDQARNRLVIASERGAVWEWDGQRWGQRAVMLPGTPTDALYDATRERVVFVAGGRLVTFGRGGGSSVQTFEWDGTGWQLAGTTAGQLSGTVAAAFDEQRGVTVAVFLNLQPVSIETREWNGTTWTLRASTPLLAVQRLAYDSVRRQVLAFGEQVRAWDGATWTPLPTRPLPMQVTLASDPAAGLVWIHSTARGAADEVLAWDGTDWTPRMRVPHPNRIRPGLSFDASRGVAVAFGGLTDVASNDLHEWDGIEWRLRSAAGPGRDPCLRRRTTARAARPSCSGASRARRRRCSATPGCGTGRPGARPWATRRRRATTP